eukprot:6209731-Pleurochrysis_carterae.AAC.1
MHWRQIQPLGRTQLAGDDCNICVVDKCVYMFIGQFVVTDEIEELPMQVEHFRLRTLQRIVALEEADIKLRNGLGLGKRVGNVAVTCSMVCMDPNLHTESVTKRRCSIRRSGRSKYALSLQLARTVQWAAPVPLECSLLSYPRGAVSSRAEVTHRHRFYASASLACICVSVTRACIVFVRAGPGHGDDEAVASDGRGGGGKS